MSFPSSTVKSETSFERWHRRFCCVFLLSFTFSVSTLLFTLDTSWPLPCTTLIFSMQLPILYFVTIAVVISLRASMDLACSQTSIVTSFNWIESKFKGKQ